MSLLLNLLAAKHSAVSINFTGAIDMKTFIFAALVLLLSSTVFAEDSPREAARKAAQQEMAKAQKEKIRNDRVVEQRRAERKEAEKRGPKEAEKIEKVEKKARTAGTEKPAPKDGGKTSKPGKTS